MNAVVIKTLHRELQIARECTTLLDGGLGSNERGEEGDFNGVH